MWRQIDTQFRADISRSISRAGQRDNVNSLVLLSCLVEEIHSFFSFPFFLSPFIYISDYIAFIVPSRSAIDKVQVHKSVENVILPCFITRVIVHQHKLFVFVALLISYRILFSLAALTRWNLEIILNKRFICKNCKKLMIFRLFFFIHVFYRIYIVEFVYSRFMRMLVENVKKKSSFRTIFYWQLKLKR